MIVTGLDLFKLSKLTSQQIDHITCLECCKHYLAPETAACGHTLCHTCWRGRQACPACSIPLERRSLKLNQPLQTLTEHVHALGEAFEKLFHIKLDEFILDTPGELESASDPAKNVKDWLACSQNHFSAPARSSEESFQEIQQIPIPLEISTNKLQIHTNTKKIASPQERVQISVPQDDWDKIEALPDSEEINKNKENVIGPMDIENIFIDENEYTSEYPRRSSRKRELKNNDSDIKTNNISMEKQSSKDSTCEADKKMHKNIQNWSNVKRMRKEFSKHNKKNRNKLNVSIEMCKKTQSTISKQNITTPHSAVASEQLYDIDDKTPDHTNNIKKIHNPNGSLNIVEFDNLNVTSNPDMNDIDKNKEVMQKTSNVPSDYQILSNNSKNNKEKKKIYFGSENVENQILSAVIESNTDNDNVAEVPKMAKLPFFKKSALYPNYEEEKYTHITNHDIESKSATTHTDDIEISIKIGNTLTNILIRKKKNDVSLKVNTDREIQTTLGPHDLASKDNSLSVKDVNVQNIEINIGSDNNDVAAKITQPESINNINNHSQLCPNLNKSTSVKKNTASADTATVQLEITESVEKELSSVMECVEIEDKKKPTGNKITIEKSLQINELPKAVTKATENADDLDYLNDLDIFDSIPIKETNVQLLQSTKSVASEILVSTVQNKYRTQKPCDKRDRGASDENDLPRTKKPKLLYEDNVELIKSGANVSSKQCKDIGPDSEPMNYDSIMGQVFANIDADIEDIRVSQNIDKNTCNLINDKKESLKNTQLHNNENTIKKHGDILINSKNESMSNLNEYCNQKNSENIFSICVDNNNENSEVITRNDQLPMSKDTNIDFLTPNIDCDREVSGKGSGDVEMVNVDDDSDKSVVEETPQKNVSFTKLKQKSNTANKELNYSQTFNSVEQRITSDNKCTDSKSIVNIADTLAESKSSKDVTVIETVTKKLTLETPVTINKFVHNIQHKSTPLARKSLNFDCENINDDLEQTLCPTSEPVAKTTQEKEFMCKAFENTPNTPALKPLSVRNTRTCKKCCIGGSNLTSADLTKIKLLCSEHNWTFMDKYSKDITHLVVGVDEENKSQRTVKYMCALAASKWILSIKWIEKCLQTKTILREEYYEVLDSTGEPGPRRSRLANRKLFQGITFFCMPPFSVLDVDTLKNMLEAAGGQIVNEAKEVRITDKSNAPAILLAEPENTQEDRFIYLAMELSIVPVNYEWALNCLGSYALGSVQELLLCPASLLPSVTTKWPAALFINEDE